MCLKLFCEASAPDDFAYGTYHRGFQLVLPDKVGLTDGIAFVDVAAIFVVPVPLSLAILHRHRMRLTLERKSTPAAFDKPGQ
jgi:hypothetical protein